MAEVRCLLSEAADISRHATAIISNDRRLLYHELEEFVLFAGENLRAAGIVRGARVATWMDNDWRHLVLLLAIIRIGAVAVPLNTRWPAKLVSAQLQKLSCALLIADAERTKKIADTSARVTNPDNLLERTDHVSGRHVNMAVNQPAAIVFTSGSSGEPRAAQLSYGNLYYNARGSNLNLRLISQDIWLLTLPLCHVGGLGILFRCLQAGATIALPEPGEAIESAQERFRATHLSLVATQLFRLVQSGHLPASFSAVKAILLGGSAISPTLIAAARSLRLPLFPSYGLTEMASQVTTMRPDSPPAKRETSGKLLRNRDLIIADDGEILVCGETLFQGYIEDGKLRDARDPNGWFHTGDLGSLDEDGYLTVLGRKDSMFISGGENIHPEEIESLIARLSDVERSLVVPVPDEEFGQRPVVFLKCTGMVLTQKGLAARLIEWLPKFKIPIACFPWSDELGDGDAKPNRKRGAALAAKLYRAKK